MAENKANISYRVDDSRLRELKLAALERGQSLQGMIEEALSKLLGEEREKPKKEEYSADEARLIRLVLQIAKASPDHCDKLYRLLKDVAAIYEG